MMRLIFALLALFGLSEPIHAQPCCLLGVINPVSAYTGLLDVVSNAGALYSVRAASAATRGNKLMNVCNSTGGVDVACLDIISNATTGNLVAQTIGGITCPGANCTVKTWYDISGNTNCSAAACNITQATIASRPLLTASCSGSVACVVFTTSPATWLVGSGLPVSGYPTWMTYVAQRTTVIAAFDSVLKHSSTGTNVGFNSSSGSVFEYAGNVVTATAAESTIHSVQSLITGAGSGDSITVDGTTTGSLNAGTTAMTGNIEVSGDGGGQNLDGQVFEVAIYSGDKSSSDGAVCHNQRLYFGSTGSC